MLIRRVIALIQISNGNFVFAEIIQMHTIHESNCTVIKQPRNGSNKAKNLTKHNSVYTGYQSQLTGWMHVLIFIQTSHSYIDVRQPKTKDILNIFQKGWVYGLWLSILRTPLHTIMLCKRLRVYEWLDQKCLGIHFLFLSKNNKICFEISSCKLLSFNNSTNSFWAFNGRCIAAGPQPGGGQPGNWPISPKCSNTCLIVRYTTVYNLIWPPRK